MKYLLVVTLSLIVGQWFVSCQHGNPEVDQSLNRIESLVEEHRDSALLELIRLDSLLTSGAVQLEGDAQHARYALLKTQTHDKNWIDDTNDSLILSAVRYYDDHGSKRQQMLAHFYHGAIFRNAKDYGAAFVSYRQAEQLALELDDDHYLCLIYGNLASISHATYSKDAISYSQQKQKYASLSGDKRQEFYAKSELGKAYSSQLVHDSAEYWFRQVIDSLPASDPVVQSCLTSYIELCMTTERYHLADSLFYLMKKPIRKPVDLMNKACLFQVYDFSDSAEVYIDQAERAINTPEQQVFFFEKCSWIAEMKGDYSTALEFKHKRIKEQNKVVTSIFSKSVSDYQRDFEIQQREYAEYRNAEYKRRSLLIATISLLLVAILFGYLYKLYMKRSQLLDEAIARNVDQCVLLENQETTVNDLKSQIESLQQNLKTTLSATISSKLSKLLAKRFKLIDRIGIIFFSTIEDRTIKRSIFDAMKEEFKVLQSESKTIKVFDQIINDYTDGAMTKAKKKEMDLNDNEIKLLRYMLMNLSNDTILFLLNDDNRPALNKRKDRLKQKINNSKCDFAKEILAYLTYNTSSK